MLATHGLTGLDARQIIERLDTMPLDERNRALSASIRADALVISDASGAQTSLPMPKDEFYVAVAPFVSQTHECHFHSPTGCRGELRNTDAKVTVTDASGTVLLSRAAKTFDNGFIGFWVPRGTAGQLTIEAQGKKGSVPLASATNDDPTCITTLQLT